MKRCSLCRKDFDKPLFKCQVLKEDWHGWGAKPDYKMIVGFKTLSLCLKCKETPIKFSEELYKESPYMRNVVIHPIVLMLFEKEIELDKKWREKEEVNMVKKKIKKTIKKMIKKKVEIPVDVIKTKNMEGIQVQDAFVE